MGGGRKAQWESTYVYLWLIHVNVWPKPKQYCKAITLQLKMISKIYKAKKKKKELKLEIDITVIIVGNFHILV